MPRPGLALLERALGAVEWQAVAITCVLLACLPILFSVTPWLLLAFPVTGAMPFAMHLLLQRVQLGFLAKDEVRQRRNRPSYHVPLLSLYNVFETATQGMLHIAFGVWRGQIDPAVIPRDPLNPQTWLRVAWQVAFMLLAADAANYWFHRVSHENRWLYKHLHAIHHQHAEVEHAVFSLFYVHPVEMVLSNCCFFSGMQLVPTDLFTVFLFGSISSALVGAGHSGLRLPPWLDALLDPAFHSLHHSRYRCNYAEHMTVMDRLFGTFLSLDDVSDQQRGAASKLAQGFEEAVDGEVLLQAKASAS